MRELFRDTVFGRLVRLVSRGKLFTYNEELDPSFLKKYQADSNTSSRTLSPDGERTPSRNSGTHESNHGTFPNDKEKGVDYHLIDWAPGDPLNPRNWSVAKKFFVTFQICLLTTSVYIGSAIYTAGLMGVVAQFHISQVKAVLGLTLFVLGYAVGPMIWAPMSEVPQIGRNPIYVGTLFAFVFLQFPVIYAKNSAMLLAFRFITGFIGSPILATGGASIADMYEPRKQAYGIGIWGVSAVFGPCLGPLIGGFAAEKKGWTWTIWELTWLSGFCLVFLFFFLPETSSSNILYRRTQRIKKATNNPKLKCEPEIEAEGMTGKDIVLMVLVRPFTLTLTEPICFFLHLYIALVYALLYTWFESFPIVFIDIYGFSLGTEGLAFIGILIGVVAIMGPFFWWLHQYLEPRFTEDGRIRPELRLQPAFLGAFLIPICLFWFGWSARPSVHWIMPIIGSAFFGSGSFLLFMSVLAYLGDAYPKYVASVYAGNDLMRSALGAAFPLFATGMYHQLGVGWATSLLGFLSVAFIPIPFLLYKFGRRLRKASKMANHDL